MDEKICVWDESLEIVDLNTNFSWSGKHLYLNWRRERREELGRKREGEELGEETRGGVLE